MKEVMLISGWAYPAEVFEGFGDRLDVEVELRVFDQFELEAENYEDTDNTCYFPYARNLTSIIKRDPPDLVVGWSLGGIVLLEVLLADKLPPFEPVLIGATPRFVGRSDSSLDGVKEKFIKAMKVQLRKEPRSLLDDFYRRAAEPDQPVVGKNVIDRLVASKIEALLRGLIYLGRVDLLSRLDSIDRFVRIFHGQHDRIVPTTSASYLAGCLPRANYNVINGGHSFPSTRPGLLAEILGIVCEGSANEFG